MKRRKKSKQVLVKRIFFEKGTYDYLYRDKETAEKIIKSTENRTESHKFEKAEWYVSIEYKIKKIFKSKHFEKVIYIVLSITLGWFLKYYFDKWVS
ncbi:hypothetical protein [Brumimicrobium aurantiacum]|uniref:Uncharacterized protein n=1 Tax=Brumimicrobium aurantiacum TaxID=1737063 RepID=A0A3E1EVS9_9FLAO|nr:hypothetical protein [Brumimicrobium aurantiacum]RFC53664.1 hypothetical protein DXU93_11080 [Brumimicrobium aurantiacum]